MGRYKVLEKIKSRPAELTMNSAEPGKKGCDRNESQRALSPLLPSRRTVHVQRGWLPHPAEYDGSSSGQTPLLISGAVSWELQGAATTGGDRWG